MKVAALEIPGRIGGGFLYCTGLKLHINVIFSEANPTQGGDDPVPELQCSPVERIPDRRSAELISLHFDDFHV